MTKRTLKNKLGGSGKIKKSVGKSNKSKKCNAIKAFDDLYELLKYHSDDDDIIAQADEMYNRCPKIDLSTEDNIIFRRSGAWDNIDIVYWILSKIDINHISDKALNECFRAACEAGSLDIAYFLHTEYENINKINILDYQSAFTSACLLYNMDVAKWLLEVNPSINKDEAYTNAYKFNNIDIIEWISSLEPYKYEYTKKRIDNKDIITKITIQRDPTDLEKVILPLQKFMPLDYDTVDLLSKYAEHEPNK